MCRNILQVWFSKITGIYYILFREIHYKRDLKIFVEKLINNLIKCPSLCTLQLKDKDVSSIYELLRVIMKFYYTFCKQLKNLIELCLLADWKYSTSTSLHRNCHFCLVAFTMCQMCPISSSPSSPFLSLPLSSPALPFSFS